MYLSKVNLPAESTRKEETRVEVDTLRTGLDGLDDRVDGVGTLGESLGEGSHFARRRMGKRIWVIRRKGSGDGGGRKRKVGRWEWIAQGYFRLRSTLRFAVLWLRARS